MVFPFTFKLPVPDIHIVRPRQRDKSTSPPVIVSKKRRWVPDDPDVEEVSQPPKRRRSLAGSIVSTALSAALIGTAVGLTVYRLWCNRGKITSNQQYPAIEPPPPYQETERTSTPSSPSSKSSRKHRSGASYSKRHHVRPRLSRARAHIPLFASGPNLPPTLPDLDPEPSTSTDIPAPEDQMDWIGDQLSVLIAEGKRALGCEIVVMSDAKEDEVDDGSGAWEDSSPKSDSEDDTSRAGTTRRRRAHTTASASVSSQRRPHPPQHSDVVSPSPAPICQSYSASTTCLLAPPSTPRRTHAYGRSLDSSPVSGSRAFWKSSEDINSFESPELRETMERARQRVLMLRSSGSCGAGGPSTPDAW